MKNLKVATLAALHVAALAAGKSHYKEADSALEAVINELGEKCKTCGHLKANQVIEFPSEKPIPVELRGKKFRLVDKFEKKHSIGVGQSARRFELEELEGIGS